MGGQARSPKDVKGLANARLLASEGSGFVVPTEARLKSLKPGDFIKVCRNGERFWVRLNGYVARKWHGTVSNKLVLNDDIKLGDSIFFMRKNIYDFRHSNV